MRYNKKTWIENETLLSAENFNHIEEGIETADNTANEALDLANDIIKSIENMKPSSGQLEPVATEAFVKSYVNKEVQEMVDKAISNALEGEY